MYAVLQHDSITIYVHLQLLHVREILTKKQAMWQGNP